MTGWESKKMSSNFRDPDQDDLSYFLMMDAAKTWYKWLGRKHRVHTSAWQTSAAIVAMIYDVEELARERFLKLYNEHNEGKEKLLQEVTRLEEDIAELLGTNVTP